MTFMESVAWCKEKPGVNVAFCITSIANTAYMSYSCGMPWRVDPISRHGWFQAQYSPPAPWEQDKEQIFKPNHEDNWKFPHIAGEWTPFTNWDDFIKYRDRKDK